MTERFVPLPSSHLRSLEGWGMVARSMGYVYRPSTIEGVRQVLDLAERTGRPLIPRGSGYSYGDAALNAEHLILDTSRLDRVLDWQPETGRITVEPGVTIRQLYRHVLEDGWWPPVVPGAMYPTLGGCVAVNAHGKNNWRCGTIGEHVESLTLLLPSGETLELTPADQRFRASVGGLGLLGVIVSLTLRLHRVTSGLLGVREEAASSLDAMFHLFDTNLEQADYLVGWIDAFARGRSLGRGLVQVARYVTDDPAPEVTLQPDYQDLPDTVLGLVPRSRLWLALKPTVNDLGMSTLNRARFALGSLKAGQTVHVPQAQFQFFHDFMPDWKRSFRPGGIVQYQIFVPEAAAEPVFRTVLERSQQAGRYPYLTVLKRHRRDPFLLSYGVDGYSLSLDYHPSGPEDHTLLSLLHRLTWEVVLPAGGRFYPAKDNVLNADAARESFGAEAVQSFLALKEQLDPQHLLQSDLSRRLLR